MTNNPHVPRVVISTASHQSITVLSMKGREAISELFEYRIEFEKGNLTQSDIDNLVDENIDIKISNIIEDVAPTSNRAPTYSRSLTIKGKIYSSQYQSSNQLVSIIVSSGLFDSTLDHQYQVYTDKTPKQILENELASQSTFLHAQSYLDLSSNLSDDKFKKEITCQIGESTFNFFSRLAEHWGVYYYFDHRDNGSLLSLADDDQYPNCRNENVIYNPSCNRNDYNAIFSMECHTKKIADKVVVQETNPNSASASHRGEYSGGAGGTVVNLKNQNTDDADEANFIAQLRWEELATFKKVYSGETGICDFIPGYKIKVTMQDGTTETLLIVSVEHEYNSFTALAKNASLTPYVCKFTAIPHTTKYRPERKTRIPEALSTSARVLGSSVDSNNADMKDGKYKVKFDFLEAEDNTPNASCYLRRLTQGGGLNRQNNMPLEKDTEVLIQFTNNDPNRPFIAGVMNNSMHPSAVTHVNPDHTVIKTDGMLVMSSLKGRYNYSKTSEADKYSEYELEDKPNYFKTRKDGYNRDENFIDPSDQSTELFNTNDRGNGKYIFTEHYGDSVKLRSGDEISYHEGNIYNFGGYWNFNLGKRYEENYSDKNAPLNQKVADDTKTSSGNTIKSLDITSKAGPNFWSSDKTPGSGIDFTKLIDTNINDSNKPINEDNVSLPSHKEIDLAGNGKLKINPNGAWNGSGLIVKKSFNATYDYTFGESIKVKDRVHTLDVTQTDSNTNKIEIVYHNGRLREWINTKDRIYHKKQWNGSGDITLNEKTEVEGSNFVKTVETWYSKTGKRNTYEKVTNDPNSIITEKKTYNIRNGNLTSHNIKDTVGMAYAEMDFNYLEKAVSKFDFGGETSFTLSANRVLAASISFTGSAKLDVSFGSENVLKTGAGIGVELDMRLGGTYKLKPSGKMEFEGVGITARKKALADIEAKEVAVKRANMEAEDYLVHMKKAGLTAEQANLILEMGMIMQGL